MKVLRRLLSLVSLFCIVLTLVQVTVALAQTLTTDKPAGTQMWELALKFFFGAVVPAISPMVTSAISRAVGGLPMPVKYLISSLMGLVQGGLAGAIPDFPVTIESGAEMGLATGAGGQFAWNHIPSSVASGTSTPSTAVKSNP